VRLRWLLRLYPAGWRDRYEREVSAVLDQHDCSAGTFLDLAAGALDARFALAPPGSAPIRRASVRLGVPAAGAALFGLVAYSLLLGFPSLTAHGDSNLQRWAGPDGARWAYLALGLLLAGGCAAVAGGELRRPAVLGATLGGAAGLLDVLLVVALTALPSQPADLAPAVAVALAAAPAGAAVAGLRLARRDGSAGAAALAGFWCGLVVALLAAVAWLSRDVVLAGTLAHGAWLGDRFADATCVAATPATLAACEIGDDLGGAAILLLAGPLLGAGAGAVAGLAGRLGAPARLVAGPRRAGTAAGPALFSVGAAAILAAEVAGRLW